MGDVIHALPAVTALRAALPGSRIGWAIEPQWQPLLSASSDIHAARRSPQMPVVDIIHPVPAKRWAHSPISISTLRQVKDLRHKLRAQRYDICIDLQGAVRSAWIARMADARRLIGEEHPREPLARMLFRERVETAGVHVIDQAREVAAAALQGARGEKLPVCPAMLPIDTEAEHGCNVWLGERGIKEFVLMNPGAGWGAKRWPAERYAAVALELAWLGYATVVNVGPGESQLAEIICGDRSARAFAMSGSLGQLIACTRRARLFIGGDTGPLHLSAALEVPVVGIYGPTDPARNGPYGVRSQVLRHPDSQRDHSRKTEPEAGLLTITVADVIAAARDLLQEKSGQKISPRRGPA